jgi:hypothetical protein
MTQDSAVSDLGCRPEHKASMPLLDQLIGIVLACICASPYSDEFTPTLQASKIVVVVALVQQGAGQPDVVHEQTPAHPMAPAEPGDATSVENLRGPAIAEIEADLASHPTPHQVLGLGISCR